MKYLLFSKSYILGHVKQPDITFIDQNEKLKF